MDEYKTLFLKEVGNMKGKKLEGCRRIKDGIERLTVRENERLL